MHNRHCKSLRRYFPEASDGQVTVWSLEDEQLLRVRHSDDANQEAWLLLSSKKGWRGGRLAQAIDALAKPAAPLPLWLVCDGDQDDSAARGIAAAPNSPGHPLTRLDFWSAVHACRAGMLGSPSLIVDDVTRGMVTSWGAEVVPAPAGISHAHRVAVDGLVPFSLLDDDSVQSYVTSRVFDLLHPECGEPKSHSSAPAPLTIRDAVAQALKSDRSWLNPAN